jgi:hypothetical protein
MAALFHVNSSLVAGQYLAATATQKDRVEYPYYQVTCSIEPLASPCEPSL